MVAPLRRRGGFTLPEMLLVAAIVGVLASIAPRMMLQANRAFILTRTKSELQQEARASMYIIQRRLRQAYADTIIIDRATSQPYYSKLQFMTRQGIAYTYYQSGTELRETVATRTRVLSRNLKYLSFNAPRTDDLSIISVSMTLEKNIYEARTKSLHMASEKVRVMN